jgi:hypothetical protein
MLTDAEARNLLHAAAATIEVEPAQPLPVVHRPLVWPMLVAAAAVIAVVVTPLALADRGSTPSPSNPPSPTPTLAANQIPPVMGLDLEDALELMSDRKLQVELVNKDACVSERVVEGTSPAVGAPFNPQAVVQLTVLNPTDALCVSREWDAWQLLRFARGVAPPPAFADRLTLYAGEAEPVVLSAAEAADPANWAVCNDGLCGSALSILAAAATTPSASSPLLSVWDDLPAINGVVLCRSGADVDAEGLAYLGITIAPPTDGISFCPQVTAYDSETGALEAVAIPLFPKEEGLRQPTAEAASAADAFVAWARGSDDPPAFADEVRYLVNDGVVRKMSGENATRPGWWQFCYSGVPLGCQSPLITLERYEGPLVQTGTPATSCVSRTGRLPEDLTGLELVRVDQPEARDCSDAFAVELFVDDEGQIAAVNQLPGSAAPSEY